jgi:hypothetical protein
MFLVFKTLVEPRGKDIGVASFASAGRHLFTSPSGLSVEETQINKALCDSFLSGESLLALESSNLSMS